MVIAWATAVRLRYNSPFLVQNVPAVPCDHLGLKVNGSASDVPYYLFRLASALSRFSFTLDLTILLMRL